MQDLPQCQLQRGQDQTKRDTDIISKVVLSRMKVLYVASMIDGGGAYVCAEMLAKEMKRTGLVEKISLMIMRSSAEGSICSSVFDEIIDGSALSKCTKRIIDGFDAIHIWKSDGHYAMSQISRYAARSTDIAVTTTLCQVPTRNSYSFSPSEIVNSDSLTVTCMASYNHWRTGYARRRDIQIIGFGTPLKMSIGGKNRRSNKALRIGRGSVLEKVSSRTLHSFDEWSRSRYIFEVAGEGENIEELRHAVQSFRYRTPVKFLGRLETEDWIDFVLGLDIFLYILPSECYGALDGSLQDAMLAGCAVVYMGPDGPAELIEEGISGLRAHNYDEIATCLDKLVNDRELRERLGRNAIESISTRYNIKDIAYEFYKCYKKRRANRNLLDLRFYLYSCLFYLDLWSEKTILIIGKARRLGRLGKRILAWNEWS